MDTPQIAVTRVEASRVESVCSRQVVLAQSLVSKALGGATFVVRVWRGMFIYTNLHLPHYLFEDAPEPRKPNWTAPFAVVTNSNSGNSNPDSPSFLQYALTVYNGTNDLHPNATDTIVCGGQVSPDYLALSSTRQQHIV